MFSRHDLFKLLIPMILSAVLSIAVGTADSMMVARAGEAAVSGVSLVAELDALLVIAFSAMVTGGSVCVAHALGRGDKKACCESAKQLIYVATGIALAITVPVVIFRAPLLELLYGSASDDVMYNANSYLRIMALGFPLLAYNNSGFAILRTMGDTVTSLKLSIMENILNVAGNALLIIGFDMGAAGAALSTIAARSVTTVVITLIMLNRKRAVHIENIFRYRPDRDIIRRIMRIGVPHGIESSMFQFGRLFTQVLISTMGTAGIAANSVANTLANYLWVVSSTIANASITVVGRCYGAKEFVQAKHYANKLLRWEYIAMIGMSAVSVLFGRQIIGIYSLSAEAAKLAFELTLFHCVVTCLIRPLAFNLPSVFKAAGDSRFSMAVSSTAMWLVRIGGAYLLAPEQITVFGLTIPCAGMGIMGVWVAMAGDWVLRSVFFTTRFVRGTWLKKGI